MSPSTRMFTIPADCNAEQIAFLISGAQLFAIIADADIERHICVEWGRFIDERARGQLIAMSPLASMAWLVVVDHALNGTPYAFDHGAARDAIRAWTATTN